MDAERKLKQRTYIIQQTRMTAVASQRRENMVEFLFKQE